MRMIYSFMAPTLSEAMGELKNLITANEKAGKRTIIFCEDRLTLATERNICAAVGGTFNTGVYTFARFLSKQKKTEGLLSSRGSAMAIRAVIEAHKDELKLFKKLSAASAAQSLYDTISILYSSGVDISKLGELKLNPLLSDKLHDISLVYAHYNEYLQNNHKTDRNMYLRLLPDIILQSEEIRGADVILLGFQAFTGAALNCVKACMQAAENTYGLFTGGAQDIYTNEALSQFLGAANAYGGVKLVTLNSKLCLEAEHIRQNLFEPQSFYRDGMPTKNVHIFKGEDEEEELEFIAANIKKHVIDYGERYAKISVMLPSSDYAKGTIGRVFARYKIPYYVDERKSLAEHPFTEFLCGFIECAASGPAPDDVCAVCGSFLFGFTHKERDIFRNYIARCAAYRGGVKREPKREVCEAAGFDYDTVVKARERFLTGLAFLPKGSAKISDWTAGLKNLWEYFGCEQALLGLADECKEKYPARAQFYQRAFEGVTDVIFEAEGVTPEEKYTAREYRKLIRSGFAASEISLIPPKTDAVFVGDITTTVNTGSDVVFACGLTDALPPAGADTAFLTDREIRSLEKADLKITPKIEQLTRRLKETLSLNLCAFRQELYLTYPALSGGQEQTPSEIVSYISRLFVNGAGDNLRAVTLKGVKLSGRGTPYYCSERAPALKWLIEGALSPYEAAAIYNVLEQNGARRAADAALAPAPEKDKIECGKSLYVNAGGGVSPTLLETYFTCPYRNFMQRGLKLNERQEGAVRPIDTGNFIHTVLQSLAGELNSFTTKEEAAGRAEELSKELLTQPAYSPLTQSAGGRYVADRLIYEAKEVASAVSEQLLAGSFKVRDAEKWYNLPLGGGYSVGGKVDRVDESGDMVRIVDYKTGNIDADENSYYAGVKLQLPLYLAAASKGKRPAGAYYFPANIEYSEDGLNFTLKGFMDGAEEVVKSSDGTVKEKERSKYVDAYLNGRALKSTMDSADFADFIDYSSYIARQGAREIFAGNIAPSPYSGACKYCNLGGMCAYNSEKDGLERDVTGMSGKKIAAIVREQRGEKDE